MKKFLALILFMGCTFFVGRQCKQAIVCLFLFCFEITGASHPKQCFIESPNLLMKNVRLHQMDLRNHRQKFIKIVMCNPDGFRLSFRMYSRCFR